MIHQRAVPQNGETPLTLVVTPQYVFRYAYVRASESQAAGENGQDFIAFCHDEQRLAFAVCDGVSQSFYGDLAARLLGLALVDWFWQAGLHKDPAQLKAELDQTLSALTVEATRQVVNCALPPELPPILARVLEKRQGQGSESMFTAAAWDFSRQQLFAAWLGDIRLRLFDSRGRPFLSSEPCVQQRWSSLSGMVGALNFYLSAPGQVGRVLAYTDGLEELDRAMAPDEASQGQSRPAQFLSSAALKETIGGTLNAPTSDDVSILDAWATGGGSTWNA